MHIWSTSFRAVRCSCHTPFSRHKGILIEGVTGWYLDTGAWAPFPNYASVVPACGFFRQLPSTAISSESSLSSKTRRPSILHHNLVSLVPSEKNNADSPLLIVLTLSNHFLSARHLSAIGSDTTPSECSRTIWSQHGHLSRLRRARRRRLPTKPRTKVRHLICALQRLKTFADLSSP